MIAPSNIMTRFPKSFLMVVALLVLSEVVVRVGFNQNMSGRFEYGYHPTAGFVEDSEGVVELVRAGGRRFHAQRYPTAPSTNRMRVMVVGDSVPRGSSLDKSYVRQMTLMLEKQGIQAEGWNLAVAGYGARRVQIVLRKALEYRPDLIILHLNNSNEFEDEREWKRSREFKGWHPKNWLMKSLLIRRLYEMKLERVYWEWLSEDIRNIGRPDDINNELQAARDPQVVAHWQQTLETEVARSVRLCTEAGISTVLISQARMVQGETGTGSHQLVDAGVEPLGELHDVSASLLHLSMRDLLKEQPLAELFADTAHLKPAGHAILAQRILEEIRRSDLPISSRFHVPQPSINVSVSEEQANHPNEK